MNKDIVFSICITIIMLFFIGSCTFITQSPHNLKCRDHKFITADESLILIDCRGNNPFINEHTVKVEFRKLN